MINITQPKIIDKETFIAKLYGDKSEYLKNLDDQAIKSNCSFSSLLNEYAYETTIKDEIINFFLYIPYDYCIDVTLFQGDNYLDELYDAYMKSDSFDVHSIIEECLFDLNLIIKKEGK